MLEKENCDIPVTELNGQHISHKIQKKKNGMVSGNIYQTIAHKELQK
jgi:hypothetical protein